MKFVTLSAVSDSLYQATQTTVLKVLVYMYACFKSRRKLDFMKKFNRNQFTSVYPPVMPVATLTLVCLGNI